MIAVGHTSLGIIAGAVVVTTLPPTDYMAVATAVALIAGLLSHYGADLIPHGHYDFRPRHPTSKSVSLLALDLIAPLMFFGWFALAALGWGGELAMLAAAVFGALLPDILDGLLRLGILPSWRMSAWHKAFHHRLHWHNQASSPLPRGARPLSLIDLDLIPMFLGAITAVVWLV